MLYEQFMVIVQLQSDIFVTNISEDMSDDTALQPIHLPNGSAPDSDDDGF
jgi:hypothetical protein